MIELYDRGCTQLKNNPEELLSLALVWLVDSADGQSMREFVEEVVDEEEGVRGRHDSLSPSKNGQDPAGATMIVLTPIRASKSQREKHKCDMILSPVRKSTRLMKNEKEDNVGDKLIGTTYAYANNKNIGDRAIDCFGVC